MKGEPLTEDLRMVVRHLQRRGGRADYSALAGHLRDRHALYPEDADRLIAHLLFEGLARSEGGVVRLTARGRLA